MAVFSFDDALPLPPKLDNVDADQTARDGELLIKIDKRKARLKDDASFAPTKDNAWRYIREGSAEDGPDIVETYLGPVINVYRGNPLEIHWRNTLGRSAMAMPSEGPMLEDPPINVLPMDFGNAQWKSMNRSVGVVTHLHGGKVPSWSDGWPLKPMGFRHNPYHLPTHRTYFYPNDQRAAMLWFHDHAMDNTAPQVHAGLAGLYVVRDDSDTAIFNLIGSSAQEIPLIIQDRWLTPDRRGVDYGKGVPLDPSDPTSFARPEFLGPTILVNGRPRPYVDVARKIYRLRILNGSNARTYALALVDWNAVGTGGAKRAWYSDLMTVIGNEAGLISASATLSAPSAIPKDYYILLAPGERLDILLDLTSVDPAVTNLRLVNLAVASAAAGDDPEAIFQTQEPLALVSGTAPSSIVEPEPTSATDTAPLDTIDTKGIEQAHVMELRIAGPGGSAALNKTAVDAILAAAAADHDFRVVGAGLAPNAGAAIAQHRFIVLMNDTTGNKPSPNPLTGGPWRDTQIWEMAPPTGGSTFRIPFDAKLAAPNAAGSPAAAGVDYAVARAWFFKPTKPADPVWRTITDTPALKYAQLHKPTIRPVEGTYERWYVANIGNEAPGEDIVSVPDMHPFHIHLVNFVVTKRWRLNSQTKQFEETTDDRALDFNRTARHDLVRVQSNELLELLVYFPRGYYGRYPYHCHIVEHEDMGMMLHFEVRPEGDEDDFA